MPLVKDRLLDLLTSSPACYHETTDIPCLKYDICFMMSCFGDSLEKMEGDDAPGCDFHGLAPELELGVNGALEGVVRGLHMECRHGGVMTHLFTHHTETKVLSAKYPGSIRPRFCAVWACTGWGVS